MLRITTRIVAVLALAACASSTHLYTPPGKQSVSTEKLIGKPFSEAWDSYVSKLSEDFFVINNISKESRIINVSISANTPSDYVDCGQTARTLEHPRGNKSFNYVVADSSTFEHAVEGTNLVDQVVRDTDIQGRVNVFMAPQGKQTLLRVNVKYVWTAKISISGMRTTGGLFASVVPYHRTDSVSLGFSSTKDGKKHSGGEIITCRSKGILEDRLLNLIG